MTNFTPIVEEMLESIGKQIVLTAPVNELELDAKETIVAPEPVSSSDEVFAVDLQNALRYALTREVGLLNAYSKDDVSALVNFLRALVEYYPVGSETDFLVKLSSIVESYNLEMSSDQYDTALELAQINSKLPDFKPYKRCLGSEERYRGYPCSLWTLFHTLTVGSYRQAVARPDYDPRQVLRAIHGYVKHFFTCKECAENFVKMYGEDAESTVKRRGDEVLWLWKAHNKVNKRLSGDVSEDPLHPKILFPDRRNCPSCYNGNNAAFNEREVLDYLVKVYSHVTPGHITQFPINIPPILVFFCLAIPLIMCGKMCVRAHPVLRLKFFNHHV